MTAPAPTPITGQPTLDAILDFLAKIAETLDPIDSPLVEDAIAALREVSTILDPAVGREVEREADLAAMFAAKDLDGLLAYYHDQPAHPEHSRAICANYIRLLGATP